jgi:hypothetical protein
LENYGIQENICINVDVNVKTKSVRISGNWEGQFYNYKKSLCTERIASLQVLLYYAVARKNTPSDEHVIGIPNSLNEVKLNGAHRYVKADAYRNLSRLLPGYTYLSHLRVTVHNNFKIRMANVLNTPIFTKA